MDMTARRNRAWTRKGFVEDLKIRDLRHRSPSPSHRPSRATRSPPLVEEEPGLSVLDAVVVRFRDPRETIQRERHEAPFRDRDTKEPIGARHRRVHLTPR